VSAEKPLEVLQIDESVARRQQDRLQRLRAERSGEEVRRRLDALKRAAEGTENLMPHLYEAVKAYATLGEICETLRTVFGAYEEVAIT
jgi:methylmalonyl-CoA mutase, N-terminal domain